MSLLELFCEVATFCVQFLPTWQKRTLPEAKSQRNRKRSLCLSEVLTLLLWFHRSGYRTFKDYYTKHVLIYLRSEFPGQVSYNRFVEYIPSAFVALCAYLKTRMGTPTGSAFVDSTPLRGCHNARIHQHKVFAGLAKRGKSTVGWFFGVKLHLIVNERGELLAVRVTAGNVHDQHEHTGSRAGTGANRAERG